MATDSLPLNSQRFGAERSQPAETSLADLLRTVLMPLASLRLTVVLLSLAIVLVFVGTLAQATDDVWNVVSHYFRSWFAFVPFQVLFPPSFFPDMTRIDPKFGFWIPGGWTIGGMMAINLLAAHGLRFKVQASGQRLWSGVAVIVLGCLFGWAVAATQQESDSLTGIVSDEWNLFWTGTIIAAGLAWAACAYRLFAVPADRAWERWLWVVAGLTFGGMFCWLMVSWLKGDGAPIGSSYTRILWQLIKATAVGLVLLAGSIMVFRKRGGVVLLHAGIGLMMANELVVYGLHVETQTTIYEGETKNWTQDIRTTELAIIDRTNPAEDRVITIPKALLLSSQAGDDDSKPGQRISDERLPFDVELRQYIVNSRMHEVQKSDANLATQGIGLDYIARPYRPGTGTDVGGEVDFPTAYVTLYEKGTDRPLGTYVTSPIIDDGVIVIEQSNNGQPSQASRQVGPERIKLGDKKFDLVLRYQRYYLPYTIELKDFRKDDYLGTKTPRNFSSDLVVVDPDRNVNRDVHISMNNPYRYRGDTLYQSGFTPDQRGTTLSIVSNQGWMVPYLSCMIVVVGLLAHFAITLLRFIQRRTAEAPQAILVASSVDRSETLVPVAQVAPTRAEQLRAEQLRAKPRAVPAVQPTASTIGSSSGMCDLARWFPMLVVVLAGLYLASKARVPSTEPAEMDIVAFGQLPVMEGGRVKPFDTLARQSLTQISDRQTYVDADGNKQPAIRWLLDVIAKPTAAGKHKIVRIHNTDVLAILKIEPAEGSRYTIDQISENSSKLEADVEAIRARDSKGNDAFEKKLLDVDRRLGVLRRLRASFMAAPAEQFIALPEVKKSPESAVDTVRRLFRDLKDKELPLSVPGKLGEDWLPYSIASDDILRMLNANRRIEPTVETTMLANIFDAYSANNAADFNRAVYKYRDYLEGNPPTQLAGAWLKFEAFFNHFEPFYYASLLYVLAFVLGALAWLGWSGPLNKAAFYLVVFTFAFHTAALIGRIIISGRPPVTNLYSSAIFIAWGCVGLGLILEMVYRLGLGTIVAAISGFASLLIAHLLATVVPGHNGDTMGVLQAVLDTQFWLATHVVCITLGYSTTFVAGVFGLIYVVKGLFTTSLDAETAKDLTRMTYGTLCFAIFFSFFGTVLGGLWADDSWGRFWGWDPKENGALIIVLWNALILHARWGGLVKDRGLAVLAIGGNIVTAWSWFGVNELGKGLHSYGFTEGVLAMLGWFVLSQFVFMALGSLPKHLWASFRTSGNA